MINLIDIIEQERAQHPIALVANTGGSYNANGTWIPNATANQTIAGAMQPAKDGERLFDDRNGSRIEIKLILWTKYTIQVDDRVTYRGETYRVVRIWDRAEAAFYKAALGAL